MEINMAQRSLFIYLIIFLAAATRLIPHMENAAPITALAIFAGAFLPKKQALVLPLAARFVSDIFLGFFAWPLMVMVYAAHVAGVLFGLWIKRSNGDSRTTLMKVMAAPIATALIFFLTTNFAFLYPEYPHDLSGVILSYTNALPFLRGTLTGDMLYTVGVFGAYALVLQFAKHTTERRSQWNLQ